MGVSLQMPPKADVMRPICMVTIVRDMVVGMIKIRHNRGLVLAVHHVDAMLIITSTEELHCK